MPSPAEAAKERPKITTRGLLSAMLFALVATFAFGAWATTALVTVPPIGAIPDGVTVWVWRTDAMNFIDSPDAMCQRRIGGVSLLCRVAGLAALSDKIIARLPYSETLYLWSTGGSTYSTPASPPSPERESPAEQSASDSTDNATNHDTTAPNKPPPL